MAAKIKKGDRVVVLTGRDKGKQGEVLKVMPTEERIVVAGVAMMKRHQKPTPRTAGSIESREAAIHVSNVAHVDPISNTATRIGFKTLEDGRKVRFAKRSGEVIDR